MADLLSLITVSHLLLFDLCAVKPSIPILRTTPRFAMSIAVSPMAAEASSPMITSVTPTLENDPNKEDLELRGPGVSGDGTTQKQDRYQKPPPLHTGADWKVVLHLPDIETWLRTTTGRVRDLTHSVQQDNTNRHVDVHLVQLKVRGLRLSVCYVMMVM